MPDPDECRPARSRSANDRTARSRAARPPRGARRARPIILQATARRGRMAPLYPANAGPAGGALGSVCAGRWAVLAVTTLVGGRGLVGARRLGLEGGGL